MPNPANINQVADFIISFAQESGSFISNLKLQKLVYYAQAWHLAIKNTRLFDGSFQAWIHGPVNPDLYQRFKRFGYKNIELDVEKPTLDSETTDFLNELLEQYFPFDAYQLERLSHQEEPWIKARGNLDPTESCSNVILESDMALFYRARMTT
jgi:uncharacterized phage-associated protein